MKCVGGESCCLCSVQLYGKKHTHTDKWSSALQRFLLEVSVLKKCDGQCVCRACEVNVRKCMEKKEQWREFSA